MSEFDFQKGLVSEAIERAHQIGYIELGTLGWAMAFDDSFDGIILQLLKRYQCDRGLSEAPNRLDMWNRLLDRWTSGAFDERSFAGTNRAKLPVIRLIPYYKHDYKTGAFLKMDPILLYATVDHSGPYIKLEEFKEYLSNYVKIELPAALFPTHAEASNKKDASPEKKSIKKYPNIIAPIETGGHFQWNDIKITFITDFNITVNWPGGSTSRSFNNAGFENKKNGKPIKCWETFRDVAGNGGSIPYGFNDRKQIEKRAQELNSKLHGLFPDLPEKPIEHEKDRRTYTCNFQIESQINEFYNRKEIDKMLSEAVFDPEKNTSCF